MWNGRLMKQIAVLSQAVDRRLIVIDVQSFKVKTSLTLGCRHVLK